ncbi:hypothetical protein SSP531S_15040 [Streptomyces spongiicola]|uniref:Secreted protein n=1 Tax=Streptomyces spongiicola TaxID=1690221 RepID=A0A2S1YWZ3_9ACTN|nr:hypothetical protein [Streptomyces spongiicola]AWK08621.1 hypothetical protein DDQ41_06445 [Streptomyces spongiicola]GBQ00094.1 hypothetical protein SSP531S_15040 [Streptomyces spongiicola]
METVILILALLFAAFVALGVYAGVKAVGAAKRGVDRTISQARRTVEDTTLRARSLGQVGVAGELAQLRLRLRTSMKATQDALRAGAAEDASLRESIGLFERLSVHGRELDEELRRLEREPDRGRTAERLPQLRERVERITHSAESLRWAARDRARSFAEDDLESLAAQIDVEAGALRDWSRGEPVWPGPAAEPAQPTAAQEPWAPSAPASRPSPPAGGRDEREPGDPGPGTGAQEPRAIPARDPRLSTGYSWDKTTRPEPTN